MAEKKNEVITFRTGEWVKNELQKIADYNRWSVAQTANQIIINYLLNPHPGSITISAEELIKAAVNIRKEGTNKGVDISINIRKDFDSEEMHKFLDYRILECGGLGYIDDFEGIKELSQEEILNLP